VASTESYHIINFGFYSQHPGI